MSDRKELVALLEEANSSPWPPLNLTKACRVIRRMKKAGETFDDLSQLLGRTLTRSRDPKEVSLLLDVGADVDARDTAGAPPLHDMMTIAVARVVIEHGADLSAVDDEGNTALHAAVLLKKGGPFKRSLLKLGVPDVPNNKGLLADEVFLKGKFYAEAGSANIDLAEITAHLSDRLSWEITVGAIDMPYEHDDEIELQDVRAYMEDVHPWSNVVVREWTEILRVPIAWDGALSDEADHCGIYDGAHRRLSSSVVEFGIPTGTTVHATWIAEVEEGVAAPGFRIETDVEFVGISIDAATADVAEARLANYFTNGSWKITKKSSSSYFAKPQ